MELQNKTKRPLRIPLPGGKTLHLGPGKTGQITPKAAEHPPVVKLVEAGEVEVVDSGHGSITGRGGGSSAVTGSQQSGGGGGNVQRQSGDR